MAAPLCLFWTIWQVRNRAAFEDVAPSTHRMMWSWANLYGVDNTDSLVDFLAWLVGKDKNIGFDGYIGGLFFF